MRTRTIQGRRGQRFTGLYGNEVTVFVDETGTVYVMISHHEVGTAGLTPAQARRVAAALLEAAAAVEPASKTGSAQET